MFDDRRRPLREDELARIARAIDPRTRATRSAPILGGVDAATYALDLDVAGDRRELVVRIFTLPEHRDGAAARRYWNAITAIPADAGLQGEFSAGHFGFAGDAHRNVVERDRIGLAAGAAVVDLEAHLRCVEFNRRGGVADDGLPLRG